MAVQLLQVAIQIFSLLQLLFTAWPYQALARLPPSLHSSNQLSRLSPDELKGSVASAGILHRSQFPNDFMFGSGTSAYQVEGAISVRGKGMSIWDTWSHIPGNIKNGDTGDVAADQYNRYEEDIDLVAGMKMDSYRFSIAWTRIFPNGTGTRPNLDGVDYYNRVIDAALNRGIKPFVTLFHWDLPQSLQDSYGGWLSDQIVSDFALYAKACFEAFGDRVKHWATFNEPKQFLRGYGSSNKAPPGRTANPSTEPYLAAHNVLLAHGAAVDVYRRQFNAEQKGLIGITVSCIFGEPLTNSTADKEAADRSVIFQTGWFLDPLYFGDYPAVMRTNVDSRLPRFSQDQVAQLKGSLDFIGLNHYTTRWVTDGPGPGPNEESSVQLDQRVTSFNSKDGIMIGPAAASPSLLIVPRGIYGLLKWTSERYDVPIFVTENGMDYDDLPMEESLHDTTRVQFYQDYLSEVLRAAREGVDVRGYFAWSLLDSFEWNDGYSFRFGLVYVDYNDDLKRYPKDSADCSEEIQARHACRDAKLTSLTSCRMTILKLINWACLSNST